MKNLNLFYAIVLIAFFSCNDSSESIELNSEAVNENIRESNSVINQSFIISVDELNQLNSEEKRVANLLNAAISGIQSVSYGGEFSNYAAQIEFSKDESDKFSNIVFIAPKEDNFERSSLNSSKSSSCSGSCEITGIRSGVKCAKAIVKDLDECGTLSATIERTEKGVKVTWKKP